MNNEKYYKYCFPISDTSEEDTLFDYQKEAIKNLNNHFNLDISIPRRNGLLVMPTGSGKTHTVANWILKHCITKGYQVIWLAHRVDLVEQAFCELRDSVKYLKKQDFPFWKDSIRILPISSHHISAEDSYNADIYVSTIQSLSSFYGLGLDNLKYMLNKDCRDKLIVVIDEAHHTVSKTYQALIKRIKHYRLSPNCIILGLTATPYRVNKNENETLKAIYDMNELETGDGFVYEVKISTLIKNGTLSRPIYIPVNTNFNGIDVFAKDYEALKYFQRFRELSPNIMQKMASHKIRNTVIMEEYLKNKHKYGKTLIFALTQTHAKTLCKKLRENGINCDYAITDRDDSLQVIQRFKENAGIDVLVNVNMMIEGSDVPDVQTVFLTRPTNSKSVLEQMIGRALRGKKTKSKNAEGTETAYVVAVHDFWDSYISFLDPLGIINPA